jgi:hypothetical protein
VVSSKVFISECLDSTVRILLLKTGCNSISPALTCELCVFPELRNLHPVRSINFKKIITDQQTCWKTWKIQFNFVSLKLDKFRIPMNKQLPQFHIYLLKNVFPLFSNNPNVQPLPVRCYSDLTQRKVKYPLYILVGWSCEH